MSSVAMKDILNSMEQSDDELTDIFCGVAFLRLLLKRWKTIELATAHFCDPADHYFYIKRVIDYMSLIQNKSNFGG